MKIKVTSKRPGAHVNLRRTQSMKNEENIVGEVCDGDILEAKLSKSGEWYKTDEGYILASLCVEVDEPAPDDGEFEADEFEE